MLTGGQRGLRRARHRRRNQPVPWRRATGGLWPLQGLTCSMQGEEGARGPPGATWPASVLCQPGRPRRNESFHGACRPASSAFRTANCAGTVPGAPPPLPLPPRLAKLVPSRAEPPGPDRRAIKASGASAGPPTGPGRLQRSHDVGRRQGLLRCPSRAAGRPRRVRGALWAGWGGVRAPTVAPRGGEGGLTPLIMLPREKVHPSNFPGGVPAATAHLRRTRRAALRRPRARRGHERRPAGAGAVAASGGVGALAGEHGSHQL